MVDEAAPSPALLTVSWWEVRAKVAVTVFATFIVTVHLPSLTESQPDHEGAWELASGVALRVTSVPLVKLASQVPPQLIPAGSLVTVPVPVPFFSTVSWRCWRLKVAL